MTENFKLISWENANDLLKKIVGYAPGDLDKLNTRTITSCLSYEVNNWEVLPDDQLILKMIQAGKDKVDLDEDVFVITEISYVHNIGVLRFNFKNIESVVVEYFKKFGECFFNGDIYFIFPKSKVLIFFQHDGFFIFYNLPLGDVLSR